MSTLAAQPFATMSARTRLLILLCVSIPSFMINLDANIVAVSLPSIGKSLHADFAAIEWVISAYTLTFAALVLPAGALADRFGRKRMLVTGLTIFTVASLLCGAAPTASILNAARAAQGVGAALQLSAALAILSHEFRGPDRAPAFAFWGSVIGIAITLGPLAGGIITQSLGWEWAFYINVPVGVALIALVVATIEESGDPEASTLDIPGSLTFSAALFLLTFALISGNHRGWTDSLVVGSLLASAVIFALFIMIELRSARPMLDLGFFRQPTYVGANLAGVAFAATLLTMLTYLPLFFQGGLGESPIMAGLLMLPIAVPLFLVPRIVSRHLVQRVSGRTLVTVGLALVGVGMSWIAVASTNLSYTPLIGGLIIAGIGAGILNGETAKVSMSVIPPERAGMASGVGGTVRFTGIVVGFAALGAILYARATSSLDPNQLLAPFARTALAQSVVAGDLAGAARTGLLSVSSLHTSFAVAYQTVFATAAAGATLAAAASWLLIRASDTPPSAKGEEPAPMVE